MELGPLSGYYTKFFGRVCYFFRASSLALVPYTHLQYLLPAYIIPKFLHITISTQLQNPMPYRPSNRNIECWRWNSLVLFVNYNTQIVSILSDMRDSGGCPTLSILFLPFLSLILAISISIRDPIVRVSCITTLIHISFCSLVRYESVLFMCPVAPYGREYICSPQFALYI